MMPRVGLVLFSLASSCTVSIHLGRALHITPTSVVASGRRSENPFFHTLCLARKIGKIHSSLYDMQQQDELLMQEGCLGGGAGGEKG